MTTRKRTPNLCTLLFYAYVLTIGAMLILKGVPLGVVTGFCMIAWLMINRRRPTEE